MPTREHPPESQRTPANPLGGASDVEACDERVKAIAVRAEVHLNSDLKFLANLGGSSAAEDVNSRGRTTTTRSEQ